MTMASDNGQLLRRLQRIPGVEVKRTARNHHKIYFNGAWVTTLGNTPSAGKHGTQNAGAILRRAGVPL